MHSCNISHPCNATHATLVHLLDWRKSQSCALADDAAAAPAVTPVTAAAVTTAPAVPLAPVAKAPAETPAQPATLQQRGEAIFDLAVSAELKLLSVMTGEAGNLM